MPIREKQGFLLMIPNGEGWHYLAVKKLSALSIGTTSKHKGDFYCLNCLHSFRTKSKVKSHKKVCQNKDFLYDDKKYETCRMKYFLEYPNSKDNLIEYKCFVL